MTPNKETDWVDRFRQKDRRALARLLSWLDRGQSLDQLGPLLLPQKNVPVIAFTGSGGVGKSTLIGKLVDFLRTQKHSAAVLACDPESPLSGGAILGDRFRMNSQPDDGVFIRSLATPGGQGAVAEHLPEMIHLLQNFGFDVILIETVGAGQGDTIIRSIADVVVLLLQPESGDDLQWEKAGVQEIADVIVLHKDDLPGADHLAAQIRNALDLAKPPRPQMVRVSSKKNEGFAELWKAIQSSPKRETLLGGDHPLLRYFLEDAKKGLTAGRKKKEEELETLFQEWEKGIISSTAAKKKILDYLLKRA